MQLKEPRYKVLAEILSAAAVVLSLVFVGLEVRETARQTELNTEALQITAYQDLIAQIGQFNEAMLDAEMAALYMRLTDPAGDWSSLSPVERLQAERILFLLARHADLAFYQFEQGLLPEARLESALRPFMADINKPMYRDFWEANKRNFIPSFQAYIDRQIGD